MLSPPAQYFFFNWIDEGNAFSSSVVPISFKLEVPVTRRADIFNRHDQVRLIFQDFCLHLSNGGILS